MLLLINLQQQHIEVKKFLAQINGKKKQYVSFGQVRTGQKIEIGIEFERVLTSFCAFLAA